MLGTPVPFLLLAIVLAVPVLVFAGADLVWLRLLNLARLVKAVRHQEAA